MYNIALMTDKKQREIEIDQHAALLIHNFNKGKVNRRDIHNEVNNIDDEFREYFRGKLNEYRSMK